MPRVTLTYDLPKEEYEFLRALRGADWARAVEDLNEHLRSRVKYEELDDKTREALSAVREELWRLIDEYSLQLD